MSLFVRERIATTTRQSSPNYLRVLTRWPWLGPSLRCDTLCTSGFMDDVIFAQNGQEEAARKGEYSK